MLFEGGPSTSRSLSNSFHSAWMSASGDASDGSTVRLPPAASTKRPPAEPRSHFGAYTRPRSTARRELDRTPKWRAALFVRPSKLCRIAGGRAIGPWSHRAPEPQFVT